MAIGVAPGLRVNTYRHRLQPGEIAVLCTDGLHGVVNEEEIARALSGGAELGPCCQKLVALARDGGGPDNITVVLLRAAR
jgi:protein phosphatase